jgi:single-strand DNA-binding protein
MNKVILCGRIVRDPDVRYGQNNSAVAKYTLAVDRKFKKEGEPSADFINCTAFGKSADFAEKYFRKGTKILITGRIQTGSYKNKDEQTVYTTDVIVEEQEFAESKKESEPAPQYPPYPASNSDGFMSIPDGIGDELPFR